MWMMQNMLNRIPYNVADVKPIFFQLIDHALGTTSMSRSVKTFIYTSTKGTYH